MGRYLLALVTRGKSLLKTCLYLTTKKKKKKKKKRPDPQLFCTVDEIEFEMAIMIAYLKMFWKAYWCIECYRGDIIMSKLLLQYNKYNKYSLYNKIRTFIFLIFITCHYI